jgi:[acyl-carrier-protein] S-malonyltransferase
VMKLSPERIAEVCAAVSGIVEIANLNSPGQTAISGEREAVAEAGTRFKVLGARVIPLKVSAPFHCSLMKPAAERLASDLAAISFGEMTIGIVSNVTAELIESPDEIPTLLKEQVTKPVRWADSLLKLRELGVERFLEFGSGQVLTSLVGRTLAGAEALAITNMKSLGEAL